MANLVQLKRSSVANKIPDAANVAVGEPVVNLVDKILYTKNGSNAIVVIGAGTTSNIAEGVNLYYTESRANTAIDNRVTKSFVDALNIDADTLDGIDSASFLRSDANDTATGNINLDGVVRYDQVRFKNSNVQRFSQVYSGGNVGSPSGYFSAGEYQEILGLIPSGSAQNYQVIGRIAVQSGGNTQVIYFQAALRSNTLPDLTWSISYYEEIVGGVRYVDPVLWAKETTTAEFKLALNGLATIFGTVTVDIDIIHRASNTFDNVTMNTDSTSEVLSVPADFTSYAFTRLYTINNGIRYDVIPYFGSNVIYHAGNDGAGSGLDADTLDGIQAASFALSTDLTTANVTETTNLYYTNARVRSAFTAGDGIILESNGQIVANVVSSSVTISNTAPSTPNEGDLYFDNELLTLFVYYDDGDTQQWVEASPSAANNPFEFSQAVGGSATEIYRFDKTLYRGGKFLVTLNDSTNFKIEEVFVVHDGTDASVSESYLQENQALIGSIDVSYTANIVSGNVILYGTANSGSPTAKGEVNLIRI